MSEEENLPDDVETYDLMLRLDRLESLREDLEETGLNTLAAVESALALTTPTANPEKRTLLEEMRQEFLDLGLSNLAEVEAQIDELNEQLDTLDEDEV